MIYYNQVKGSKRKQKRDCPATKLFNLSNHKASFHLPLIHSIISISLEKSMKNPKTQNVPWKTSHKADTNNAWTVNIHRSNAWLAPLSKTGWAMLSHVESIRYTTLKSATKNRNIFKFVFWRVSINLWHSFLY